MSTVLITGPTAGIGKSLADQMAEKGHDLLLVARRENRLKEISLELQDKYDVKVDYFVADLKDKNAPREIFNYSSNIFLISLFEPKIDHLNFYT